MRPLRLIACISAGLAVAAVLGLCACSKKPQTSGKSGSPQLARGIDPLKDENPFPSTYKPLPSLPTAITGVTILTATGEKIDNGTVLMRGGRIEAVRRGIVRPAGYRIVALKGGWVTPGVIDPHSHLGVYPSPGIDSLADGNEMTDPDTAQVWAEHSIWPQDPGFNAARAGGVTTLEILPGSGNLFGGRSVILKNVPSETVQGMKFPGAPQGLKMACGENPRRIYGAKGRAPSTRMGSMAGYREAWIKAAEYRQAWDAYDAKIKAGETADPPKRDLQLDTLADALRGRIGVQMHCYRADEMAYMIDLAKEFGYRIVAFHHASEAYKIPGLLKTNGICAVVWGAGWWGYKMEAFDGIEANAAMLQKAGVCVSLHSDDATVVQHLPRDAAIAIAAGRRIGIDIGEADAVKWFTINPARVIGVAERTGSLENGKDADVVLWDRDPFSVYAVAEKVYVDGALVYDAHDPKYRAKSDFDVGLPAEEGMP